MAGDHRAGRRSPDPGTVTFGDPTAVDTTASFGAAGTYMLRLTADDSALTGTDDIIVTVQGPATRPRWSTPGRTPTITLPATASLDGTVTDDGPARERR